MSYTKLDSDNNITFKLRTHGKNNKTNSITLSSQLDKIVNKYNVFTKNLILKTTSKYLFRQQQIIDFIWLFC